MKLSALKRTNKFTHDIVDGDGAKVGAAITGYKKQSSAYMAIEAKHNPPPEKTRVMSKDDMNYFDFDNIAPDKQFAIAVDAVTDIAGIDGFECTPESVAGLFKDPETEWIYFQWLKALESSAKNSTA